MTRKSSRPMLKSAGIDTANENNRVRIPLADFTSLNIRPTLKTLTTRRSVGEIGKFLSCSDNTAAVVVTQGGWMRCGWMGCDWMKCGWDAMGLGEVVLDEMRQKLKCNCEQL